MKIVGCRLQFELVKISTFLNTDLYCTSNVRRMLRNLFYRFTISLYVLHSIYLVPEY